MLLLTIVRNTLLLLY